jgi:hypothetical protein
MNFIQYIKTELLIIIFCVILIILASIFWLPYLGGDSIFCSSKGSCKTGVGYVLGFFAVIIIVAVWNVVHKWRNGI